MGLKYNDSVTVSTSGTAVGTAYKPVYVNSSGVATQCTVTDNSSATAISTTASVPTTRTIYYGLPTINGSHSYTSSTSIYAPTSVGTSGYVLSSSGSGAPSWVDPSTLSVASATTLGSSTVGSGTKPIYLSSGTATASSSTVGAAAKPIYMSSGTLTAMSGTLGGTYQPIYQSSGTLTAGTSYGNCLYKRLNSSGSISYTSSENTTVSFTVKTGDIVFFNISNSAIGIMFVRSTTNIWYYGPLYLDSTTAINFSNGSSFIISGGSKAALSSGTLTFGGYGSVYSGTLYYTVYSVLSA